MSKKHSVQQALTALFLLLCFPAALTACSPYTQNPDPLASPSVPLPSTTAQPAPSITVGDEPLYDGVLCTAKNGDQFFTPGTAHCVTDAESAVLYYNNLLLVFTDGDLSPQEQNILAQTVGGEAVGCISDVLHAFQIIVPTTTLSQLVSLSEKLMQQPSVLYACPEYPVQIMGCAADQNPWGDGTTEETLGDESNPDGLDWWAEAIGAYTAWEYADLCRDIRVGIVDNGFFIEHEDLQNKITLVTNENRNTTAEHGTHVAGIIAANNNDIGIRGIADTASLYCADLWPADDPNSFHTMAEYLCAINAFAQHNVRVVNNSWACIYPEEDNWRDTWSDFQGDYAQLMQLRLTRDLIPTAEFAVVLIAQLINSGHNDMIFVQGAGNSAADARYSGFFAGVTEEVYNNMPPSVLSRLSAQGIHYEDIDQRILVAGAVMNARDDNGNYHTAFFSNYGETVDILAPGMKIFSTIPSEFDFYYAAFSGTSMAAPMVTGSVAFLWSLNPNLSVSQIRQLLLSSCPTIDTDSGSYPMLNIGAAAQALLEP